MKTTLVAFVKHYIFWFLVFILFRVIFLFSAVGSNTIFPSELIQSLVAGYKLDWSTASYFAILPWLFTLVLIGGADKFVLNSLRIYYGLLILIVIVLSLSNIIIYKYWGTLLNSRGLAYVAQPREMLASVTTLQLVFIIAIVILAFAGIKKFYNRFLHVAYEKINGTVLQRSVAAVMLLPLLMIGIRGGLQLIPVNESAATFSAHRVLNQAAINNIWYLGHNVMQSGLKQENPYQWMTDQEAQDLVEKLITNDSAGTKKIFDLKKPPNVVLILLESWTADVIEPLGGIKGVTPGFSKLAKEGLLFTNIYSSGFRTDQALVSVLSGFPSQPNNSIIRFPDKTTKLPSITTDLKKQGYATSFYYGGELGFANMNSYLVASGFEKIVSINDFESNQYNSKWGAHDQYVFDKQFHDLNKKKQPFFSTLLTLSTHEPFEVPVQTPFTDSSEPELFKKSAWYTDQCLTAYFEKVKKTKWFENTIFILVADHGHRLPMKRDYFDPLLRKIPLLVWSPLLKPEFAGAANDALGAQHDLAATLLNSLEIPAGNYEWSNNLLDSNRVSFAYLSLDMAVTWLEDTTFTIIPLEAGLPGYNADLPAQKPGKAYLQHLYTTFLSY